MSTDAIVRAQYKTTIETVDSIGKVYDRMVLNTLWDQYLEDFKTSINGSDTIRVWMITCTGINPVTDLVGDEARGVPTLKTYPYIIRGYSAVNDDNATENSFFALCETVLNNLDEAHATIANLANVFTEFERPVMPIFDTRLFGSVLCHYAEIRTSVQISGRGT